MKRGPYQCFPQLAIKLFCNKWGFANLCWDLTASDVDQDFGALGLIWQSDITDADRFIQRGRVGAAGHDADLLVIAGIKSISLAGNASFEHFKADPGSLQTLLFVADD